MPMNKSIMDKHRKQMAERASYAHVKSCATHRTDPRYDVYDGNNIIKRGLSLSECAAMGKGYEFKRVV